jgi:hypothetical protein
MSDTRPEQQKPPVLGYAPPSSDRSFQEALTEFCLREMEEDERPTLDYATREPGHFPRWLGVALVILFYVTILLLIYAAAAAVRLN